MKVETMEGQAGSSESEEIDSPVRENPDEETASRKPSQNNFAASWSVVLETMARRNLVPISIDTLKSRFEDWIGKNNEPGDTSTPARFLDDLEAAEDSKKLLKRFRGQTPNAPPRFPTEARRTADLDALSLDPQTIQRRAAYAYAANQTPKPWR